MWMLGCYSNIQNTTLLLVQVNKFSLQLGLVFIFIKREQRERERERVDIV